MVHPSQATGDTPVLPTGHFQDPGRPTPWKLRVPVGQMALLFIPLHALSRGGVTFCPEVLRLDEQHAATMDTPTAAVNPSNKRRYGTVD